MEKLLLEFLSLLTNLLFDLLFIDFPPLIVICASHINQLHFCECFVFFS